MNKAQFTPETEGPYLIRIWYVTIVPQNSTSCVRVKKTLIPAALFFVESQCIPLVGNEYNVNDGLCVVTTVC